MWKFVQTYYHIYIYSLCSFHIYWRCSLNIGCSAHSSDWFLDECPYFGIIPILIPPHSPDQCQPLDSGVFGIMKLNAQRIRPGEGLNKQTKQIIKMLSSWRMSATPINIVHAFKRAGIKTTYNSEVSSLICNIEKSDASAIWTWELSKKKNKRGSKVKNTINDFFQYYNYYLKFFQITFFQIANGRILVFLVYSGFSCHSISIELDDHFRFKTNLSIFI